MPRTLGPLQLRLLDALRRHGRETNLGSVAAYAAGLTSDLGTRLLPHQGPSWAQYSATARAVAALRRRGLIQTRMAAPRAGGWCGRWRRSEGRGLSGSFETRRASSM
jgi:hypothetical protein